MTMESIDRDLMDEHLKAHHVELSKLRLYQETVQDEELLRAIQVQTEMMEHHVEAMEALLRGQAATLPSLSTGMTASHHDQGSHKGAMSDHDIAMDCRLTTHAMGADNYFSAQHMKSTKAKEIHFKMAQQNAEVGLKYEHYVMSHRSDVHDMIH